MTSGIFPDNGGYSRQIKSHLVISTDRFAFSTCKRTRGVSLSLLFCPFAFTCKQQKQWQKKNAGYDNMYKIELKPKRISVDGHNLHNINTKWEVSRETWCIYFFNPLEVLLTLFRRTFSSCFPFCCHFFLEILAKYQ